MQKSSVSERGKPRRLWEENHDFYHSSWKSMRLLIHLDLGAADVAPLESHPLRLQARIAMRTPQPDGLRTSAEAEPLFALEDLLASRLRRAVDALYVGRIIGGGELTLVWYIPWLSVRQQEVVSDTVRELGGEYPIRLSQTPDPVWGFYYDFLFPDVYNLQVMLNRRRLLVLMDHDDDGVRPRLLDHRARFSSLTQAQVAMRQLQVMGFDVDEPEMEPQTAGTLSPESGAPISAAEERSSGGNVAWSLTFSRRDSLANGRIDEVCTELLDVLLPSAGHYEGWGTELRTQN